MLKKLGLLTGILLSFCLTASAVAETPTFIESAADGKRLVKISGNEIIDPNTEKTLYYIHENEILVDIHAPATLVVDDHSVRHSTAGVILATFDSGNIRHGDAVDGKVLIYYKHPDLCPDFHADRTYTVNGPELSKVQLVAVMNVLKPETFKLSEEETAAQQKAIAAAAAEAEKEAAKDHITSKWMVLSGSGPVEKIGQGMVTFGDKKSGVYPVTFDYTKAGGPTFNGVAWGKDNGSGDWVVWSAYGTPKATGLCVYDIDGGKLGGKWYPWYVDGDAKNVGTEELKGPETLDGDFEIVSAKAPTTGAAYTGKVTIKPLTITGAGDDEKAYSITWDLGGGVKVKGIGIRTKNQLFVASGSGADALIAKFTIHNGSFTGDFFKLGSDEMGTTTATGMN